MIFEKLYFFIIKWGWLFSLHSRIKTSFMWIALLKSQFSEKTTCKSHVPFQYVLKELKLISRKEKEKKKLKFSFYLHQARM